MKKTLALLFATLILVCVSVTFAQQKKLVGKLKIDADGPGCYYGFSNGGLMFFDSWSGDTWMNIDGRDVNLSLVKDTKSKGKMKKGSRITKLYSSGDITINMVATVTKMSAESELSAIFTVKKGNRTQVVKATGVCGD
jgi:hypothetical protein